MICELESLRSKLTEVQDSEEKQLTMINYSIDANIESEAKLRAIVTTATDAIIILNEKAETTFWNDAAVRIFGFTSEEIPGKNLHTIIMPERYYKDYKKGFAKFVKTGNGPLIGSTREVTAQNKDGKEFPGEIPMSAFMNRDKWNSVGKIMIIQDVSRDWKIDYEK